MIASSSCVYTCHTIWIQFNYDAEVVESNSETTLDSNKPEFRILMSLTLFYLNMVDCPTQGWYLTHVLPLRVRPSKS